MNAKRLLLLFSLMLLLCSGIKAQLPFEVFAGNKRATVDLLFFRSITSLNEKQDKTPWLFFHRTRASVDYRMNATQYLPQFGFTEAISYNHKNWKGFAPVAVAQILNSGLYTKLGIQWVKIHRNITAFTWFVAETKSESNLDYFLLFRYTPNISKSMKGFFQAESINTIPSVKNINYSFAQRFRMGVDYNKYQAGLGIDLAQNGRTNYNHFQNVGVFFRHDF